MRRYLSLLATTILWFGLALGPEVATADDRSDFNFTGLHVGGQIGGAVGNLDVDIVDTLVVFPSGFNRSRGLDGIIGGVKLGYDYQWDGLVFGILANYDWSNAKGTDTAYAPVSAHRNITKSQIKHLATLTARLGYVVNPRWLIYAEGGRAWAKTKQSGVTLFNPTGALAATFDGTANRTGWVVGGGAEFLLDGNWSLDFGYKFIDFGSQSVTVARTHMPSGVRDANRQNESLDLHTVKLGINYRF